MTGVSNQQFFKFLLKSKSAITCIDKRFLKSIFFQGNDGRIVINLGYWNEAKHLEWVKKNPSKMPKPKGARK